MIFITLGFAIAKSPATNVHSKHRIEKCNWVGTNQLKCRRHSSSLSWCFAQKKYFIQGLLRTF
jgi:hypothetical protein